MPYFRTRTDDLNWQIATLKEAEDRLSTAHATLCKMIGAARYEKNPLSDVRLAMREVFTVRTMLEGELERIKILEGIQSPNGGQRKTDVPQG